MKAEKNSTKKQEKPKRPPFHLEFAEKIIERLKEGTAPWQRPWHPGKQQVMAPHNPASGTVYRGMNRVNLGLSDFEDSRWMTLKQANEQGMHILPGSKATPVVYYQFSKEVDRLDENGKPVLGEDGKALKKTVELDRPIIRYAHVFNAQQIDGMPPLELTDKAFDWEPVDKAESILSASGAVIKHDQSNQAFYSPLRDEIHLPPKVNFDAPEKYYATALHELGHWTGDASRLNRESGGPFGSAGYAREELRAEIASWMLGQDIGIAHDPGQHASYVQSWVKALEEDPFEIVRACRDAEHIKEYILGLEMKKERQVEQPGKVVQREMEEGVAAMGLADDLAKEKTLLNVPFKEKEQAKSRGARWDREQKSWYAPVGTPLSLLKPWLPENTKTPEPLRTLSPQEEFSAALIDAGLDLQGKAPIMDGAIHRVPLFTGKQNELDGAYCGYLDDHPAGWMQNFSSGEKTKWVATGHSLSKEQMEAIRLEAEQKKIERAEQLRQGHEKAAELSLIAWKAGIEARDDHPYLKIKGVPAIGLHENRAGVLHIPAFNVEGELRGLQTINADGEKRFVPGMEKSGNFHLIAAPDKDFSQGEILLSEGYATGASLHMATGKPVAVAFDAGNLEPVAVKLREKFPNAAITICADNDHKHTRRTPEGEELWNKDVELAQKAAQAVGGKVVAPIFTDEERARGLTDFNDLHQSRGLGEVKMQVGLALQHSKENTRDNGKTRELSL